MKYRTKSVTVEAIRFNGENAREIFRWMGRPKVGDNLYFANVVINTPAGKMFAARGDWVIKGVKGEFYPCKDDIFRFIYEKVTDEVPEEGRGHGG